MDWPAHLLCTFTSPYFEKFNKWDYFPFFFLHVLCLCATLRIMTDLAEPYSRACAQAPRFGANGEHSYAMILQPRVGGFDDLIGSAPRCRSIYQSLRARPIDLLPSNRGRSIDLSEEPYAPSSYRSLSVQASVCRRLRSYNEAGKLSLLHHAQTIALNPLGTYITFG